MGPHNVNKVKSHPTKPIEIKLKHIEVYKEYITPQRTSNLY